MIIMLFLFPFLLLLQLQLPAFSEHYKIHPPNWDDISQSLGFHLLPKELNNDDNKNEIGNDDGKSSIGTGSPPFTECGISDYEPPMSSNENIQMDSLKIHNGHIVPNAEAMPWMATVWYNGTNKPYTSWLSGEWCTATVISKWHILMAAHCIYPYYIERPWTWPIPGPWGPLETDSFPVVVGTTNFNDSSAIHRRSRRVLPHPDYRMFWFSNLWHLPYFHYINDIAIIELAEPLEFSSKIRPICLSKKGVPEPQKDAIISGWGTYAYNETEHSILLRVGRNEILNASGEECQGWKAKLVEFQANKSICTRGQGGTIIMDGDSGAPLMVKIDNVHWTQIGITTGSYEFGGVPNRKAAFVRVSAYCDWIEKTTANIVKCT